MEWEASVLAITGVVVLLANAFGEEYHRFVENIKATGWIPEGKAGLIGNLAGILFFGVIGLGLSYWADQDLIAGLLVGSLAGFLISLRASQLHEDQREIDLLKRPASITHSNTPISPGHIRINGEPLLRVPVSHEKVERVFPPGTCEGGK